MMRKCAGDNGSKVLFISAPWHECPENLLALFGPIGEVTV